MDLPDLDPDPLVQLQAWLGDAEAAGIHEPNAMVLSTAGADAAPDARFVLLRGIDARGLAFYTNYASPKARALEANPRAALTFGWGVMQRQVRVQGNVQRVTADESDAYFATRPRGAQIGAWASPQSSELGDREELDSRVAEFESRFAESVPRPPHWGGFRVRPERVEFWQGRPNRLHDRILYSRSGGGAWARTRLAP